MTQLSDDIRRASELIRGSNYLVALSGAGLSAGSGIPTYRGEGGLWTQHGTPPLLSYQEFASDPAAWWARRLAAEEDPSHPVFQMKQAADGAVPNAGHLALAELERRGVLRCVITQNVDNLHGEAGSSTLLEIHGNRNRLRCLECSLRFPREEFDLSKMPPRCGECGGMLKLDTVMFGEPIPTDVLEACREASERCDCMLLVGTSGTVNPAARLPLVAKEGGATLIEVNPEATPLTRWCDIVLSGPADVILPRLLRSI